MSGAAYRTRDLGYGVEEGEVDLPAVGDPDWVGKRPYLDSTTGETVYLFDDEVDPLPKAKTRTVADDHSAVVVRLNDLSWLIDALGDFTDLSFEDDPRLARLQKAIADY